MCIAIQETNERMGHELKNLQYENDRLTEENDKVESAVEKWVDLFITKLSSQFTEVFNDALLTLISFYYSEYKRPKTHLLKFNEQT